MRQDVLISQEGDPHDNIIQQQQYSGDALSF